MATAAATPVPPARSAAGANAIEVPTGCDVPTTAWLNAPGVTVRGNDVATPVPPRRREYVAAAVENIAARPPALFRTKGGVDRTEKFRACPGALRIAPGTVAASVTIRDNPGADFKRKAGVAVVVADTARPLVAWVVADGA
jgi:hypothetical protein